MRVSPFEFRDRLLRTIPQLRAYARAMLRYPDRADDLLQETLLRAWEKQDTLRDIDLVKPWLLAIMRNLLRQEIRELGHRMRADTFPIDEELGYIDGNQEASSELNDVAEALSTLPIDLRDAITLVLINGLSYDEAAELMGCAVGTLKSRINRGRQKLAERLSDERPANGDQQATEYGRNRARAHPVTAPVRRTLAGRNTRASAQPSNH